MTVGDIVVIAVSIVIFSLHRGVESWIGHRQAVKGKSVLLKLAHLVITIFLGALCLDFLKSDWSHLFIELTWTSLFCFYGLFFYLCLRVVRFSSRYD